MRARTAPAGTPPRARRGRRRRRRGRGSAPTTRPSRAPPPGRSRAGCRASAGSRRRAAPSPPARRCRRPRRSSSQVQPRRDALGRAEDPLEVDGAVGRRLGRVVDDHLAEVRLLLERVRRQDPDLDEVAEVGELVERGEALDACRPAARSRCGARSRAASARGRCPRDGRAARSSGTAWPRREATVRPWARHRTGCAKSAARCSATGSPSASNVAPAAAGSSRTRTRCPTRVRPAAGCCCAAAPSCNAPFSSIAAVDCEECGGALRDDELFGSPIKRAKKTSS